MRLIIVLQFFLLAPLLLTRASQSETNGRKICEPKDPYAEGFLVYSELLLDTIKKKMNQLKEECNKESETNAKDNCIAKKENPEEEIRNLAEENESLRKETQRLEQELKDIKESLENPVDCAEIQLLKSKSSGLYKIRPKRTGEYVDVLCDLDETKNGGGWTVFLNRQVQATPESFNRTWEDYKEGFGNKTSEFWLGNDLLHSLTTYGGSPSTLRVDAEDFYGDSRWAEWNIFHVDDEEHKYNLTVENYQEMSTLGDGLYEHDGSSFTTFDADNDNSERNCANTDSMTPITGGFWYNKCGKVRPTDRLSNDKDQFSSAFWEPWVANTSNATALKRNSMKLKRISMKFRRHNYKKLASQKRN